MPSQSMIPHCSQAQKIGISLVAAFEDNTSNQNGKPYTPNPISHCQPQPSSQQGKTFT